jgi:acetoacetyl-CoA synthetase
MFSTGSPLAPESFDYVYRDIKADLLLASISGGTDILSCFALGVRSCRFTAVNCNVAAWAWPSTSSTTTASRFRPAGRARRTGMHRAFPGNAGRLLERSRRRQIPRRVFRSLPNVWCHGDFVELTANEGMIIYGRSDAVLNPGGVRIGTAEIYRQVEQLPEVVESLVIGQEWEHDVRVVLFVKLREGMPSTKRWSAASSSRFVRIPRRATYRPRCCRLPTSRAPRAARSSNSRCATSCMAGR